MFRRIIPVALSGVLALSLAATAAFAQDNSTPPVPPTQPPPTAPMNGHHHHMSPDRQLEHMSRHLNLTADQQAQIRPLLVARQQQMRALWQDQSLSRQDRHQKMRAIQQETSTKIEAVLNNSQRQKYEAMQKKMRERREQRMEQYRQQNQQQSPQS